MSFQGYKKLIVWQKADELAYQVYKITAHFPKEFLYGLTSQLRRSALSVPANIAEGCGRQNHKELRQFINIALGSLAETEYYLDFSLRLFFLSNENYATLNNLRVQTGKLLWKLYKAL